MPHAETVNVDGPCWDPLLTVVTAALERAALG
jgi:hypothetical protein